jgi:hypothetical protein
VTETTKSQLSRLQHSAAWCPKNKLFLYSKKLFLYYNNRVLHPFVKQGEQTHNAQRIAYSQQQHVEERIDDLKESLNALHEAVRRVGSIATHVLDLQRPNIHGGGMMHSSTPHTQSGEMGESSEDDQLEGRPNASA